MEDLLTIILVLVLIGLGWFGVHLLTRRCWACGQITKSKSPGGLPMCEDCGGSKP